MTSSLVADGAVRTRRERIGWQLTAALLIAAAMASLPWVLPPKVFMGVDLEVFRAAGSAVLHGQPLYHLDVQHSGTFKYLYTPIAALLFVPLALPSSTVAYSAWSFLTVLTLQVVAWSALRLHGVESRRRRATLMLAVTLAALPLTAVGWNFWLGQINIALLMLVFADLSRSGRWRGVGVGLAAGIKLTPMIFIVYLLLTRQFRAAGTAVAAFVGTVLVGFLVLPRDSWQYWTATFFDTSRMLPVDGAQMWNQSLRGLIAPLSTPDHAHLLLWFAVSAVVGLAGLALATVATRRGDELTGLVTCGLTALLVSPVSWPGHWVWCVPLLVLLAGGRTVRAPVARALVTVGTWLVFASPTLYWVLPIYLGKRQWPDVSVTTFTWITVVAGVALLVLVAATRRTQTPSQPTPAPARTDDALVPVRA